MELLNDTPMAMWDTSDEQDFEWADALDGEINAVVNALSVKPSKGKSKDEPIVVASSDDEQENRTARNNDLYDNITTLQIRPHITNQQLGVCLRHIQPAMPWRQTKMKTKS